MFNFFYFLLSFSALFLPLFPFFVFLYSLSFFSYLTTFWIPSPLIICTLTSCFFLPLLPLPHIAVSIFFYLFCLISMQLDCIDHVHDILHFTFVSLILLNFTICLQRNLFHFSYESFSSLQYKCHFLFISYFLFPYISGLLWLCIDSCSVLPDA